MKKMMGIVIILVASIILYGCSSPKESVKEVIDIAEELNSDLVELSTAVAEPAKTQEQLQLEFETYISDAEFIVAYHDLARNPERIKGKKVAVEGVVTHVEEDNLHMGIIIAMSWDEYGNTADYIWVDYIREPDGDRILMDELITVWGPVTGLTSYDSLAGITMNVPALEAQFVEYDYVYENSESYDYSESFDEERVYTDLEDSYYDYVYNYYMDLGEAYRLKDLSYLTNYFPIYPEDLQEKFELRQQGEYTEFTLRVDHFSGYDYWEAGIKELEVLRQYLVVTPSNSYIVEESGLLTLNTAANDMIVYYEVIEQDFFEDIGDIYELTGYTKEELLN